MRYVVDCEAQINGDIDSVWEVWTDMASFPEWDKREQALRLDGPFAVGVTGFSKQIGPRPGSPFRVIAVEAKRRWVNECPLPGGRLVLDHRLEDSGNGKVKVTKRYEVLGPMAIAFRFVFSRAIIRDTPETLNALGVEARRRAASRVPAQP